MYCITDSNPGTTIEVEDYDSAPRAELVSVSTQPLSCLKRGEKWYGGSSWGRESPHLRSHGVE